MKIELKKVTCRDGVWYKVFYNGSESFKSRTYETAYRVYMEYVNEEKINPDIEKSETLESTEI